MHILALDIGTSSIKAAVLDVATANPAGMVLKEEYTLDHTTPDAAEFPAERLWQVVTTAARKAVCGAPAPAGIGLATMTPVLVLLGKDEKPLTPIWTHLDRRSRPAARLTWNAVGPEFLREIGNRPLPGGITAVVYRQLVTDDPTLPAKVKHHLHLAGWLGLRMTGERAMDSGNACLTGLFGTLTDHQWASRWCDYFGVDQGWLPPVVDGATTIGTVRAEVAAELGVAAGIPVKLGTVDTSSTMLAADMEEGDLLHTIGTTQVVVGLTRQPQPDPRRVVRLHGVGDLYIQAGHNPVGGVALEWLHRLCFRDQSETEFYGSTFDAARQRQISVQLDPAFLGGDRLEIEAHRAAFKELTLATDRLDLLTAVQEAMIHKHREALIAVGLGDSFRRVILAGGAAKLMQRLLPEYATERVELLEEGSLRGVAKLFR